MRPFHAPVHSVSPVTHGAHTVPGTNRTPGAQRRKHNVPDTGCATCANLELA